MDVTNFFEDLRKDEFNRLNKYGDVYLDYTGGNLYPKSLMLEHQKLLLKTTFGNPHSKNPTSELSLDYADKARKKVLDFFNAGDEYWCVFTANATAAIKIVGESYPFNEKSHLLLLIDNHTSIHGIGTFCNAQKGQTRYISVRDNDLMVDTDQLAKEFNEVSNAEPNLFAFPAQSNYSGVKHDLGMISQAKDKGFDVLLDAAAFVPTSKLDLSKYKPDYVALSFYKMFGYPTGVGCLLIKKEKFEKLKKPWFGGGSMDKMSVVDRDFTVELYKDHQRFEDGTIDYLNLSAITAGLNYIDNKIGIDKINDRVTRLTARLMSELKAIKHTNGAPVVKIYGPENMNSRGGNIAINILGKNGEKTIAKKYEDELIKKRISVRIGYFCNHGLNEFICDITAKDIEDRTCGNPNGKNDTRGAIRVSVGWATIEKDINAFLDFVKTKIE